MSAEAIIKRQARDTLRNNYPKALTALIIVLIPYYIIDGGTTILSCVFSYLIKDEAVRGVLIYSVGYTLEVLALFFFSPVINGYIRAHYNAAYTGEIDLADVYYYFSGGRYKKALALNIRYILRLLLPAALFYLPVIALAIIAPQVGGGFSDSLLYNDLFFLLNVISTTCLLLYSLRYFIVFTIQADIENLTPGKSFEYSRYVMKNRVGSAAKLALSFIPWFLLCLLVLPTLYVIPYFTQSLCISAKWMTKATFEVK